MRLFVPLRKSEFDALRELAQAERRRPQDQAAVIIAYALENGVGVDVGRRWWVLGLNVPPQSLYVALDTDDYENAVRYAQTYGGAVLAVFEPETFDPETRSE